MENSLQQNTQPEIVTVASSSNLLKMIILGLLLLLPVVGVGAYYFGQQNALKNYVPEVVEKIVYVTPRPTPLASPVSLPSLPVDDGAQGLPAVACTMDAKICPDGSAVGRSGPNCEFAPCPVQGSGNSGSVNGSRGSMR